jgi:hypothetical protein
MVPLKKKLFLLCVVHMDLEMYELKASFPMIFVIASVYTWRASDRQSPFAFLCIGVGLPRGFHSYG